MKGLPRYAVLGLLAGCSTPQTPSKPVTESPKADAPVGLPPSLRDETDQDLLLLKSGEWIAGRIVRMRAGTLEFASDGLGTVSIDWTDVERVTSPRRFTMMRSDREAVQGTVRMDGDNITIETTPSGVAPARELTMSRGALLSIIPDGETEWDVWAGEFSLSLTARSGNTEQVDTTVYAGLTREDADTRFSTTYNGSFSEVQGTETANTQRSNTRFDLYISERLFVTPLGFEYFRDPFQNIASRVTPNIGLGYQVLNTSDLRLEIAPLLGWQRRRFESVPAGVRSTDDFAVAILPITLGWDIASGLDFDLSYQAQLNLEDTEQLAQNLRANLSVDLISDIDLALSLYWDRAGDIGAAGTTQAEADDLRFTIGIAHTF